MKTSKFISTTTLYN